MCPRSGFSNSSSSMHVSPNAASPSLRETSFYHHLAWSLLLWGRRPHKEPASQQHSTASRAGLEQGGLRTQRWCFPPLLVGTRRSPPNKWPVQLHLPAGCPGHEQQRWREQRQIRDHGSSHASGPCPSADLTPSRNWGQPLLPRDNSKSK